MAAGTKRLIEEYIEKLEIHLEDIKALEEGMDYAAGWSMLNDMDDWFDIKDGLEKSEKEIRETLQLLRYQLPQYEDKTYEEMHKEKYGYSE